MKLTCYNTNMYFIERIFYPVQCCTSLARAIISESTCLTIHGGIKLPRLSRKSIEAIANRVTTAYKRLPSLQGQPLDMIQPELLTHDLLGLTIEYHTLSRDGGILGLTACDEMDVRIYDDPKHPELFHLDGRTLLIDSYLVKEGANEGRYHFTLTHEACHQIFKMLFPKEYATSVRLRQIHYCTIAPAKSEDYWDEWRTNALASSVLMPEDMVRNNMLVFGLDEKLPMLNRVYAPGNYNRLNC